MVASLEAPDEFLKNRVMNLPESVVAGTHNTEEGELYPVFCLDSFRLQLYFASFQRRQPKSPCEEMISFG